MDGQYGKRIVQPACVCEYGDAAQKGICHEKAEKHPADGITAKPRPGEKYIHGNAAELEGKIPPVVLAVSEDKSQSQLLCGLASRQNQAAKKEKAV